MQQIHNQGGISSLLVGGGSSNIEVIMETDMEGGPTNGVVTSGDHH
jgi:hypothetical protein